MAWADCQIMARKTGSGEGLTDRERRARVAPDRLRRVYEAHYGVEVPRGLGHGCELCHHCDEPRCDNPEHIFIGTQGQNLHDAAIKGRLRGSVHGPGELHRFAKLNAEAVYAIRDALAAGESQASVGRRFGVHQVTVGRIGSGQRWGHLPPRG